MKIALLNDTHFGCRNDSPAFVKYQNIFYNDIFFPYLIDNNIKTLIHLGDVVDRRKFINHNTAYNFKKVFWDRLDELGIETHIIIGNHDTYYKNTNEVNALENLNINKNAKIYTKPKTVNIDDLDILFLPWICDDNYNESVEEIENTKAAICMGHLEIKGFEMHNGHMNEQGLDKNMFRRFEKVLSGHFHKRSDDGQVYYLGTQYEMTWSDYKCPKGFHIFDTATRELERIKNPNRMFKKITYNDKTENYYEKDISEFSDKIIKMFVTNKTNEDMFDDFVQRLHSKININELNIIEDDYNNISSSVSENILEQGEDTITFLQNYIEQSDTDLDKQKLKSFAKELYMEALDN